MLFDIGDRVFYLQRNNFIMEDKEIHGKLIDIFGNFGIIEIGVKDNTKIKAIRRLSEIEPYKRSERYLFEKENK